MLIFIFCNFIEYVYFNSFLVESLWFLHIISCHLQIVQFYFFLSNLDAFYFLCLMALARNSNTVLSKSGESEHPCLVPDLRGKAFSFLLLNMMLAMGLLYMAFIMLSYIPSTPVLLRVFIINGCWILLNTFSASIEMIIWLLSFILLRWHITLTDLLM